MKNFKLFERLWEHGRTLRRVGLVLVMCLIAIPQVWADKTIYFRPSAEWKYDEAWFQIWDGYNNNVASLTGVDGVFKVTLSDWATNVKLKRMKPNANPEHVWNEYDIDVTTNNYFYNSGWDGFTALTTTGVVEGGYIYFDNSKTQWTGNIQFVVGRAAYSRTYEMTQISDTKIWYVDLGSKSNHEWADATYYAFISSGSKFGDGEWGPSNITNATGYTGTYTGKYSINSGGSYWCVPSAAANGSSFDITYKSGYGNIPANNTKIQVKVKENGAADYSNASIDDKPATTIRVQGTYLSGNGAKNRSYETWTSGSETSDYGSVVTGKVSPEYSSKGSDWQFDGWYKGGVLQSSSSTYDFDQPTSNIVIEARFSRIYTVTYNSNGGSGSMTSSTGTSITPKSCTFTAPSGYEFAGWNTAATGIGTGYAAGTGSITENLTLYAIWRPTTACADGYSHVYSYYDSRRLVNGQRRNAMGVANTWSTFSNGSVLPHAPITGLTSIVLTQKCQAEDKKEEECPWINSYIKVAKIDGSDDNKTGKITINVATGYEGKLKIKAGGYSKAVSIKNNGTEVVASTSNNSATTQNKYTESTIDLTSGANVITFGGYNAYVSHIDVKLTNQYSITLNKNGGTINDGNVTSYTYGTGATLPTNVTKSGYTFDGWFDNDGLTGDPVASISSSATGAKEYWAGWTCTTPTFSAQPSGATVCKDAEEPELSVSASANGGSLSYQWYVNTTNAATVDDELEIDGATSDSYDAPTGTAGTKYYYCVVTNTTGGCSATSDIATVTVKGAATITWGTQPADGTVGDDDFAYAVSCSDGSSVTVTSNNTDVATIVGGNLHYVAAGTTYLIATATDACGNAIVQNSDNFTVSAAAPAAECITWEGTPSSWTGDASPYTMAVSTNLSLKAVGKKWDINSSTTNAKYAKVWVEDEEEIVKTVIALDKSSGTGYLQGSFADGSEIQSLTIGAANNNSTAGTNKKYVVLFSATEAFTTVLEYTTGKYAQEITAPSFKDAYNASNLEKAVVVPSGAKYFRVYRELESGTVVGTNFTADKAYGEGQTIRIFKIEACPEGSACTDPTITWDNTPANGVVGGTMTASVTSNYPAGVSYSSSVPAVASVNASTGAINYLKAGTTTITATVVGDGSTYCDLAVDPSVSQLITVTAPATGIAISPTTIDVQVGGTADLTATLTPAGAADATVNWTSEYTSNATVAIIGDNNKTARVTGVALRPSGTSFKIYAKTASLTANSWYATVRVYKGVTYDATTNEGSCATASAKYYGDAALVLPAATKDGYTFNGWYTTASSDGTKIGEAGDEYTPSANSVTLYARFTANVSTYAITYELNGGTHGTTHPATGTPDAAHELSAPTRSGYTFAGWTVSPVVSGAKWGTTSSPTTDITDASTLAQNGTSSVYFKNLAAANGAVTITAHWTQDCETSGGGGSIPAVATFNFNGGTFAGLDTVTSNPAKITAQLVNATTNNIPVLDSYYVNVAYNGNSSGVLQITTSDSYTQIDSIKFNSAASNNNNPSITFYRVKKNGSDSTTIGSAIKLYNGSSTNTWRATPYKIDIHNTPYTGKVRMKLTTGSSSVSAGLDNVQIFYNTAGGGGVETPCYHVIYHANGAERGTVEDAARYVKDATVTVKANGFTKAGADFLGWATNESRADAGTVDYDPDDSFTMGTADVDLWAVWGTAAPRVYSLTGSAYRCTDAAASTITLAGSESGVSYQLQKDGVDEGEPESGTGSALSWSKTAWGTYTVVATRSAVDVDMSGEVVLSDYPLSVTENLDGGTVAQDGEFTLSAKVSVNADNSASYTYEWFSNDAANYDTPLSLGSATAMAASTGTQEFEYNPSTAEGGTKYYFCEFTSPCGTVVRTRVVSVTVTTSTTTLTWNRDGEGDDFENLPQGGKHTITVSSNSGVAPSLAVAGTDAEITNVEQEGSTTTATLILGASAADVVLTAEVSANGTYAAKSEDKEVIVKECSSGETVLYEMHLTAYNTAVKDAGNGSVSLNFQSGKSVEHNDTTYEKPNSSAAIQITLGTGVTLQAGDKIVMIIAGSGDNKEGCGFNFCKNGSSTSYGSINMTLHERRTIATWTVPANNKLIGENILRCDRLSSDTRFYGMSIVRGGGSGSAADVASGIAWITDPDSGHEQGSKAITRSISNDPFTYAVQATTPSMGTITYASSNEAVATVDANGRVTLRGEGTTTISAKQEAIGCYMASSTLSYSLTVEACTSSEPEPLITYGGTVICPESYQTLTATNYIAGATFQWYKDGVEIGGATSASYNATEAGTYTVVAHKDCYSESSNSVTLTKMSATVDVKTLADEFTIKSERPYNFRLFEIEDGATMTVQSRLGIDAENSVVTLSGNIISISGTAPTIASAGDATVVIRISRTGGCSSSYVDKTVTIHKIPATAKKTIAWIATKTTIKDKKEVAVKGVKDEVDADKSSDVDLYQELEKYYTMTARNCYWTTDEAELVKEYSQYDLIVLTDYPNSQTAPSGNDKTKSYTNALGLLKDHIPMLTFEAYVAQCPNWEIPSNPKNTSETQNDITLLCNADEIFGTEGKFGAGQSITLSTVESGQALQGFLPADAPFVFLGSITDDATTYIACCERQVNPAARMMIFGMNANTMNNLTSDGKQMVHGFIDYLLINDAASVPDCSVIFNGNGADQNWNTIGNWEGETMPNKYASVRIDKPCVVSGDYVAQAGYLKIHTSSVGNTYTGKLTIEDDGVMAIQGTITRIEDSKYTLHLPTRPEDLIIKSTASGQGALIFDNESGTTQARVQMYSKAYTTGGVNLWQYVAVPLVSASRWNMGDYAYLYNNASGGWSYYDEIYDAFAGVGVTRLEGTPTTYTFEGSLASTKTQKMNLYNRTNMIGNSWTAPIQIVNFEESDFGGATASIFIYETGHDPDGGPTNESGNSGERVAGKWYEIPVFGAATLVTSGGWAGMKVIPAMQAFEVKNESGAPTTFTMNYERLVRNAVNDKNAARRAPQRAMASVETPTLRITMSDGEIRNDVYLLSGERFSEGFDNGWDGEYVGGNNCSQLYALSPIGNLSMSAQPEMEGTVLGFAAGTKTEFTITFHYVGEEELYLNDMEAHRSTLISGENEYTFTAESGERGNRFVIGEQLFGAPEIATGVTDLDAENLDVQKVIYNDKLFIIRGGKVFSADGQLVK